MAGFTSNMRMHDWNDDKDPWRREQWSKNFRDMDAEFGQRGVNIRWKGADPTGTFDSSAALVAAIADDSDAIFIPKGVYLINQNVTIPSFEKLMFDRNARLKIANGKTLTLNGAIEAHETDWIFDLSLGGTIAGTPKVNMYFPQWFGAKGDNTTDDSLAIQLLIDFATTTGGIVHFPKGTYKINTTIVISTSNNGKKLTIQGDGLGATVISVMSDIDAFQINGFLIRISELYISGIAGSTKSGIIVPYNGTNARIEINHVQIQYFKIGFSNLGSYDQIWISKCFFSHNSQHGVYFNLVGSGGGALLEINHTALNWNGSHGLHITNSNIYGVTKISNSEFIANSGRGISIDAGGSYNMLDVILENVDIEYVPNTADAALYLKQVKKFNVIGGIASAKAGDTINALIHLDACDTGTIENFWFRGIDGHGTAIHNIYCTNGTKRIYMFGANIFGTQVDFGVDELTDKNMLYNMDIIVAEHKRQFFQASEFVIAQASPVLSVVNGIDVWLMPTSGNPAITLSLFKRSKIKKVRVYWFNNGSGAGNVALQVGITKIESGSNIATIRNYFGTVVNADAQGILKITDLTPTDTELTADLLSMWIAKSDTSTITNQIGIVGVEIDYE